MTSATRQLRGRKARASGRASEWLIAFWLMAKGYRILGFRLRTAQAEIDILARKGAVAAVVEIKRRATLAEALTAVGPRQRQRLLRTAESLLMRRRDLAGAQIRLDLVALAPGRLPRHIADAWREE
ncbi:MAG TPA: YraN family protein [Caulobacteraceae bacterium]|nr:YraN family protein [Caulobacteraceae bacterium]